MESQLTESKPWLNNKGQLINDEQLKLISQKWCEKTWEDYLSYIESPRTESILSHTHYDNLAEVSHLYSGNDETSKSDKKLLEKIGKLTEKQQKIIFLFFWEGFSTREIAVRMKISHSAAHDLKVRALNSLKAQMEGADALRIMKSKNSKPFMKRGESHEQQPYQDATPQAS